MPLTQFNVTQVRVAASCPRIFYFDTVEARRKHLKSPRSTRIWKARAADETTACGTLFHHTVEHFNDAAATGPFLPQLLAAAKGRDEIYAGLLDEVYRRHVKHDVLFGKDGLQQQAFLAALRTYLGELADILAHARALGRPIDEVIAALFGDVRRQVEATFTVAPGEEVRVSGVLDYVFHDFRTTRNRIIDYKLTTADRSANDLFQVAIYALLHDAQHHTGPDAAVLYLYPQREMVELSFAQVQAGRPRILNLLASMVKWQRYEESSGAGLRPPGEPLYCDSCPWNTGCERRLGQKQEGQRAAPAPAPQAEPTQEAAAAGGPAELVPDDALWIGRAPGGKAVGLPRAALPTHLAVMGAAGSGKTWLAKVLVEEAIAQGVPVVAIDPQGDLVQFLRRRDPSAWNQGSAAPQAELDAEQRRYERFSARVEPRIYTPGSSHGVRLSLSPVRLARAEDLRAIDNPQLRAEEIERMLGTVAANLVTLAKSGGETDSQQTFILQILRRLGGGAGHGALSLAEVAAALQEPESLGLDNADQYIKRPERERLARKLNNLIHGTAAHLFTGGTPVDLDALCQPSTQGKVPLNVIYLNALGDDDQKHFFVASLAAEIYRWMVTSSGTSSGPRLLFYLDEARDYLPAGTRKPPAKEPLLRLFAQGRKYGVACLICTQSPRSVDYQAFSNASTKIIGRLESAQDVDRVAEWFGNQGTPPWIAARKGAEAGTFVGRWPGMPTELEGQVFRSRPLFSAHEGAWSPEQVERELRGKPVPGGTL